MPFDNDHFHPIFIILRFIAKYSISFISTSVGLTWSFIQMIQPSTHCYLAILALSNSFQGRNWLCKKQSLVQPLYKLTPTFTDLRTAQLQIISKLWHRSFYNPKCWSVGRSVCRSVKKILRIKKSKSLIIFDYLINFAASLRIGSIEGGWGWGVRRDFGGREDE